jgi:hypothetical protein
VLWGAAGANHLQTETQYTQGIPVRCSRQYHEDCQRLLAGDKLRWRMLYTCSQDVTIEVGPNWASRPQYLEPSNPCVALPPSCTRLWGPNAPHGPAPTLPSPSPVHASPASHWQAGGLEGGC